MRRLLLYSILFLVVSLLTKNVYAQENETLRGTIIGSEILSENDTENVSPDTKKYKVRLDHQEYAEVIAFSDPKMSEINVGDRIILLKTAEPSGNSTYYITDHIRTDSIMTLFLIFIVVVVLISKKSGVASLLGMGYSFLVLFKFLLPQLYSGNNPILITLIGVILIAPVSFVLSH